MRYPSMTALRALDAVARLGSVAEAANELNLTASAISHQIKSLEQTLGFALTERQGRSIRITYQGERYARDIHLLLANILEAGQRSDGQQVSGRLCISSPPGFATYWLCTHIAEFQALYPQVELQLVSPRTPGDTSDSSVDLFVAYGMGDWPNQHVQKIVSLRYFPVCSPSLVNAMGGLKTLDSLDHALLLHMIDYSDWRVWLAAAGAPNVDVRRGIIFADAHFVQSACIAGQGIAMGDNLISGEALARGQLVQPFGSEIESNRGYYLVADLHKAERPVVLAFSEWVKSQLQGITRLHPEPRRNGKA
ncbi:LysR substrate-binding domain-containing protein [Pseudomonas sp. LD120]|uniref:LysR substrate-binding domain-containing protein n=1 Tax=Pseudomonas sp. LD120 TaxID=485751 RepID=UPI001356C95C|nr:LysR substrate-binding domain-containing protein [Pseudomonas sp. LD120]KAF0864902.1 LysR family transcriptional regulator [Pseudomonas sp. LD120]